MKNIYFSEKYAQFLRLFICRVIIPSSFADWLLFGRIFFTMKKQLCPITYEHLLLLLLLLLLWDKTSSPGLPQAPCIAEDDLEILTILTLPTECWEGRCAHHTQHLSARDAQCIQTQSFAYARQVLLWTVARDALSQSKQDMHALTTPF